MALKGTVPAGADYQIDFRASGLSAGVTLVTIGWVPNQGNPVPPVDLVSIAPAATGSAKGVVPAAANARLLEIRIHLPDGRGFGTLTVTAAGVVTEGQIGEDTTWMFLVV
jgi:hypothetical protein